MGRSRGFFGKVGRGISKPFKKKGLFGKAASRGGVFDQGFQTAQSVFTAPSRLMDKGGDLLTSNTLPIIVGGAAVIAVVVATR